jgi:hypothetical protein
MPIDCIIDRNGNGFSAPPQKIMKKLIGQDLTVAPLSNISITGMPRAIPMKILQKPLLFG